MSTRPFQGAKQQINPDILNIFNPPAPPSGDSYELEDGSGTYELEDGSGTYALE